MYYLNSCYTLARLPPISLTYLLCCTTTVLFIYLIYNLFVYFATIGKKIFWIKFDHIQFIYLYTMKNLDSDDLFSMFSQGDEAIYQEHDVPYIVDNSFILFGTVITAVQNYTILNKMHINKYGQRYINVQDSIKLKYFDKIITYLQLIDEIHQDTVRDILHEFKPNAVRSALNQLLQFYENKELYETCAIILKFLLIFFKK